MRHGVQVPPIMSMARWGTRCALRYLKDSPLINITKEYRDGGQAIRVGASGEETLAIKKFGQATLKQLEELTVQVAKQDEELARLGEQHAILESSTLPKFVVSDEYQKWHIALNYVDVPKLLMKTRCGWKYGRSVYERRANAPEEWKKDQRRTRCFDLPDNPDDAN